MWADAIWHSIWTSFCLRRCWTPLIPFPSATTPFRRNRGASPAKGISPSPATSGSMSAPGRGRRKKSPPSKNGWNRAGRNVPTRARRSPIGKSLRRSDKEVSLCPIMTMTKSIPLPLSSPTWANTTRAPLWANR